MEWSNPTWSNMDEFHAVQSLTTLYLTFDLNYKNWYSSPQLCKSLYCLSLTHTFQFYQNVHKGYEKNGAIQIKLSIN